MMIYSSIYGVPMLVYNKRVANSFVLRVNDHNSPSHKGPLLNITKGLYYCWCYKCILKIMPVAILYCCSQRMWEEVIILGSSQLGVFPSQGTISIPVLMLAVIRGGVRGWLEKMEGRLREVMGADLQPMMKKQLH